MRFMVGLIVVDIVSTTTTCPSTITTCLSEGRCGTRRVHELRVNAKSKKNGGKERKGALAMEGRARWPWHHRGRETPALALPW
jgi:hypothetical protein